MRFSNHALGSDESPPSNNAPRTQRDMQIYQRVTENSIKCLRAMVLGESPWKLSAAREDRSVQFEFVGLRGRRERRARVVSQV
jgi:hypothetical protein